MQRYLFTTFLLIFTLFLLQGCSSRPEPLPRAYKDTLAWGALDENITNKSENSLYHSLGSALTQKLTSATSQDIKYNVLSISGGGSRGAFSTGFLAGWKAQGDMPHFDIVTGISTGAIIAPFVFVDDKQAMQKIKEFYTQTTSDEVFQPSWLSFFSGYLYTADPLKKLMEETFDKAFLDKIAQEHKKGRRLYIGTTNLDTGKFVVWDMGAIAASEHPDKKERFIQILLASSALPSYIKPQYISVDIEGKHYTQMHVDGGVYTQIFMVGLEHDWRDLLALHNEKKFDVSLYLVSNRKYRQRDFYEPVEQNPPSIIKAYILTEMDLLFDKSIYRMYLLSKERGYNFYLATIPDKMEPIIKNPAQFHPDKMQTLFWLGYTLGEKKKFKKEVGFHEYDKL